MQNLHTKSLRKLYKIITYSITKFVFQKNYTTKENTALNGFSDSINTGSELTL